MGVGSVLVGVAVALVIGAYLARPFRVARAEGSLERTIETWVAQTRVAEKVEGKSVGTATLQEGHSDGTVTLQEGHSDGTVTLQEGHSDGTVTLQEGHSDGTPPQHKRKDASRMAGSSFGVEESE